MGMACALRAGYDTVPGERGLTTGRRFADDVTVPRSSWGTASDA